MLLQENLCSVHGKTDFRGDEKHHGASKSVPVNALGLFGCYRKTHVPVFPRLKRELAAVPRCQWLVLTALAEFKCFFPQQSKGISRPQLSTRNSHASLCSRTLQCANPCYYYVQESQTKNHLVPLLLAARQHIRLFVLLPGKPIYLLSIGSTSSRAVYWESGSSTVICLSLH